MKYIVVEINESSFMPVTEARDTLDFRTRPVGYYRYLNNDMKRIAENVCDLSTFKNPYLLQIID